MYTLLCYPEESQVQHQLITMGVEKSHQPSPIVFSILAAEALLKTHLFPRINEASVPIFNDSTILLPHLNILKIVDYETESVIIEPQEIEDGIVYVRRLHREIHYYRKAFDSVRIKYIYGYVNGNVRGDVHDLVFNIAMASELGKISIDNKKFLSEINMLLESYNSIEENTKSRRETQVGVRNAQLANRKRYPGDVAPWRTRAL